MIPPLGWSLPPPIAPSPGSDPSVRCHEFPSRIAPGSLYFTPWNAIVRFQWRSKQILMLFISEKKKKIKCIRPPSSLLLSSRFYYFLRNIFSASGKTQITVLLFPPYEPDLLSPSGTMSSGRSAAPGTRRRNPAERGGETPRSSAEPPRPAARAEPLRLAPRTGQPAALHTNPAARAAI